VTITNETTGKFLQWGDYTTSYLPSSTSLYIDCRPGYRSCLVSHYKNPHNGPPISYGNVYHHLTTTSNINFNLVPGENRISFQFIQANYDGGAATRFRYLNRYNGI
jgi:hypothetical protein